MKRLLFTFLVMCLTMVAHAQATSLKVDCQNPGWLSILIEPKQQMTLEDLTITGKLNADDITFLGEVAQKGILKRLDLHEVKMIGMTRQYNKGYDSYDTIENNEFSGGWFATPYYYSVVSNNSSVNLLLKH